MRVVLRSPRNSATGGPHRGSSKCSTGCAMLCNGHWLPMGTRCGSMFRTETPGIPTSPAGSPSARQTSGSSSERWSGDESPSPYSPRVAPVRRSILLFATVAMLIAVAAPVLAGVNVVEVADEVSLDGLYVEPGLSADTSSLNASITRAGNSGVRLMVVLLDADPSGGAVTFASPPGSPPAPPPGTEGPASSGGGSSGLVIMLVIVGGMVLLVWFAVRKTKKSAGQGREKLIAEAKTEIRAQLDAMANTILEITDLVNASSDSQDDTYLREASATFTTADDSFAAANDLNALETLSDQLDEARWQLDAAAAIANGKPVPPKPLKGQRYGCFFDPTHGNATETAQITTPPRTQTVRVCAQH